MTANLLRKKLHILALFLIVAMLIPLFALTAFASDKYQYDFHFDGNGGTKYCYGTKTDTGYAGAASVKEGSDFNGGSAKFQLQRSNGSQLGDWTSSYSTPGHYYLYYWSDVDLSEPPISVRMACEATKSVQYLWGNFQP